MELTTESRQHVAEIASETLTQFERIAAAARGKLQEKPALRVDALANINTVTSSPVIQTIGQINQANQACYQVLANEPAIARIVVEDTEGERRTYYFCRGDQGMVNLGVISYRAPIGRLASLPIGAEFILPNGTIVEVVKRARLTPTILADGWDSRDTVVETEHLGLFTVESLRQLLRESANEEIIEDLVGQLLAEEAVKANIFDGMRRGVIAKMELRDQPILDQYQDEIFRLPLDKPWRALSTACGKPRSATPTTKTKSTPRRKKKIHRHRSLRVRPRSTLTCKPFAPRRERQPPNA